jgi:aerobic-type carbon monoxide dehydrogenase small subunit (CoxS/CutS family)
MTHLMKLTVNGIEREVAVGDEELLLDVLRERFGLSSVREGCGVGACGACTVLVDGASVSSCLALALDYEGRSVTTVEGLAPDDEVVAAFVEARALQCGYCIPGFVMMTTELLSEEPAPDATQVREHLSGNLCRCGTYLEIAAAVELAARRRRERA